jgi:hypothetical protein
MASETIDFFVQFLFFFSIGFTILGFIGNILTFKVYTMPALRKNNLSLYFRTISVFNNYQLVHMIRISVMTRFNWDMRLLNDFMCKMVDYSEYGVNAVSAWLLVVISIDRFMNIAYPRRFPFLTKRSFQWAIVLFICLNQPIYYSYMIWNSELHTINSTDPITNETLIGYVCVNNAAQLLSWLDLFNSTLEPFAFMIGFSAALIYSIRRSRKRIYKNSSMNKEQSKDRKFAVTSLTLNILFLVFNVPIVIFNMLQTYTYIDPDLIFLFQFLMGCVFFCYFAIDFYVQLAVNSIFRGVFFSLLNFKIVDINGAPSSSQARSSFNQIASKNQPISSR